MRDGGFTLLVIVLWTYGSVLRADVTSYPGSGSTRERACEAATAPGKIIGSTGGRVVTDSKCECRKRKDGIWECTGSVTWTAPSPP